MNVILVDDEKLALSGLERVVKKVIPDAELHGFSIASKALEYSQTAQIDIGFLDINMGGGIDGLELAKRLTAIHPKINIIFCTAYTDYALDAFDMYCSGYLMKPVSEKKLSDAIAHLRYPLESKMPKLRCQCFGNFEIFCNGSPVQFKHRKTKEILAYLVDRNGIDCSTREICAVIFEDEDKQSYFDHLRVDLIKTFEALDVSEFIRRGWGTLGIERSMLSCDYFDYLDGKESGFRGEYMNQYSWAEGSIGAFTRI